ncbi:prion-inhibition and propagation-domain-containing protein [Podospora didyma]|uniref:Prion-inhibition and propagation-domain-containing protein n=1 Tax=Podospora didyma TaxID=330526 RepID=A0AAE0N4Y1_9PEZI|nr:prion-inhibition and propagation-domain-containing protein [Podospora didyma]
MDPIGVSLGAASLLFQVFAGCIRAYQLISEASDFEKDYQFIRIRFKTEQYRLLDFAAVAQLTERDETLIINDSNRGILLQVLDHQSKMMMRFARLDERLQPLAEPRVKLDVTSKPVGIQIRSDNSHDSLANRFPHANVLLQKALSLVDHSTKYPGRLRWVVFDRVKVEDLLSRLVASNNYLQELLSSHQLQMLRLREEQTGYQIMQLNNRLDQVYEIVQAGLLHIGPPPSDESLRFRSGFDNTPKVPVESALVSKLVQLGQFKALAAAVDEESLTQDFRTSMRLGPGTDSEIPLQLDQGDIVLDEENLDEEPRVPGWHHPKGGTRTRVWVEWKRMDPQHVYNVDDGPDPETLRRFRTLVTLLREHDQVRQFRAPPCLGYYLHDASRRGIRYGLVFKTPPGADDPHTPPRSLRELLEDRSSSLPSLTMRVSLMRSIVQAIEKLHSVNWLHKGLCSENIIFFHTARGDGASQLGEPYLTGFDYSRPQAAVSMSSSAPNKTMAEDLYRHPGVQGGPREGSRRLGFRKRHDIYSLGVTLTEVAHWKPIEDILGVEDRRKIRVKDVISVRGKLLGRENLDLVRFFVGVPVADAIAACLVGPVALGLQESDSEEDGEIAARLQEMFYKKVVRPLLETKV